MNPIPFYMDLQASAYHRNLARSASSEVNGQTDGIGPLVPPYPRSNLYSRSISLRNGFQNGDRFQAKNGNVPGHVVSSVKSPGTVHIVSKNGLQRVILPSRSSKTGSENGFVDSMLLSREAGLFLGCAMQNFVLENEEAVYSEFTKCHKCYDLIPVSTKLIVFDTQLPVKKAFFALLENGVRAAPLWDSAKGQFVGMLSITDFIHILRRYYKSGVVGIKELEEHKIATWREVLAKDHMLKPFLTMDPKDSLYSAIHALCEGRVHRLPIVDKISGNILYILTHQKILRFLYAYIRDLPTPEFLQRKPKELGIGSWEGIATVTEDTKLIDALTYFLDKRISALPVVDQNGKLLDVYAKGDVFDLAANKSYNNLCISVKEALKYRTDPSEGLRICNENDSLSTILKIMFEEKAHRVIIADDELRVLGTVSLSDVMAYLVLRPQDMNDAVE